MIAFKRNLDELIIEPSEKGLFVDISYGDGSFGGYDDWYAQFEVKDVEAFVRKFPSVTAEKRSISMFSEGSGSWDFAVGLADDGYFLSLGTMSGDDDVEGLTKEDINAIARGFVQTIKDCKAMQAKN